MDVFSNVMLTWFNGAIAFLHAFGTPVTLAVVIVFAGFLSFAFADVEELDRQGGKPVVGHH